MSNPREAAMKLLEAIASMHNAFCMHGAPWNVPDKNTIISGQNIQQSEYDTALYYLSAAHASEQAALRVLHMKYSDAMSLFSVQQAAEIMSEISCILQDLVTDIKNQPHVSS